MDYSAFNALCTKNGTTPTALALKLGLSKGNTSSWKKGGNPSADILIKLADELNCTVDVLLGRKEKNSSAEQLTADEQELIKYYKELDLMKKGQVLERAKVLLEQSKIPLEEPENTVFIEYYSLPVSAGTGVNLDGCEKGMLEVEATQLTFQANFALRVSGCSMEPIFHDGDIVLITSQPSVEIGEIGIFILNGSGFIKKFGGDRLISLNPDYDDIPLHDYDSIYCRGKVIGTV